jgi:methylated-DNA-[protein]-cysteine S-methyltransferase
MTLLTATVETPFGDMSLVGTEETLHVASFDADLDELRGRLAPSLQREPIHRGETSAATALRKYFAGDIGALDDVAVSQPGGPFHTRVWAAMREVTPGTTVSYAELAARAGEPPGPRAHATQSASSSPVTALSAAMAAWAVITTGSPPSRASSTTKGSPNADD